MLALALGGRTIDEWKATMSRSELASWAEFYAAYPFDDRHRYHRPAALIARASGSSLDVDAMLAWLIPTPAIETQEHTEADITTLKAFGLWKE